MHKTLQFHIGHCLMNRSYLSYSKLSGQHYTC